jgi:hypothetical protein
MRVQTADRHIPNLLFLYPVLYLKYYEMRLLLILVLLSAVVGTTYAQEHCFVKMLGEPALRIIPAQHGSFYTISTQLDCPDDLVIIRHFSANGTTLKTFTSPPYIGAITSFDGVANSKNNLVLYVKLNEINHLVYEFDSTGAIIWNRNFQFTAPQVKFTKIKLAQYGYYLLGNMSSPAYMDSSRAVMAKLTPEGQMQWTKYYRMNSTLTAMTDFNDMMVDNNKLLIAGAYYYTSQYQGQGPYRPILATLDTSGNFQNGYYYMTDSSQFSGFEKYQFLSLHKTPKGGYYLGARNGGNEHAIFKLDASMNIQWVKRAPSGKYNAMCAGYDEDIMIVRDNSWGNLVLRYDSTGTVYSNHLTKGVNSDLKYGLINTLVQHNCGFLLSSSNNMIARTNGQMQYCIDSTQTTMLPTYYAVTSHYRNAISISSGSITNFNQYLTSAQYTPSATMETTVCAGTYNCSGVVNSITDKTLSADIYPNPASGFISIRREGASASGEAMIYDMNGKVVVRQALKSGEEKISVSALSPGIYLVKIVSQDRVLMRKVEVMR